jgi:hypothetical protein
MADVGMSAGGNMAGASAIKSRGTSGRVAVICVIAAIALQGLSGLLFSIGGFSTDLYFDASALLASGASNVELFHWASIADLFGYLLATPLVVYLYHRFRDDPHIVLYTATGFAYILAGAFGAMIFVSSGPTLLRAYATAAGLERAAIATTFTTIYQVVVAGLWQTLEALLGGVWLLGAGLNLYRGGSRALAILPLAFAALFLALAVTWLVTS